MESYQIVAHQTNSVFLLVKKGDDKYGRVWSTRQNVVFKKFNIQSIIARGYWEDYKTEEYKTIEEWAKVLNKNIPKVL